MEDRPTDRQTDRQTDRPTDLGIEAPSRSLIIYNNKSTQNSTNQAGYLLLGFTHCPEQCLTGSGISRPGGHGAITDLIRRARPLKRARLSSTLASNIFVS